MVPQPTVSVVIPTNRGGPYLAEAVASLRAQTVPVSEIILVDDGSPDPGLAEVARAMDVAYIRQESSGISIARNRGVEAATGNWVAFLDDDDVWHPARIERQLDALVDQPNAVAAYTGGWYMDSAGTVFGQGWPARAAASTALLKGTVPLPRVTTLLVRRDAYREVGGCQSQMEPAEDVHLTLRLLQRGEFAAVDQALVGYRRHSGNVTNRGLAGRRAVMRGLRALQKTSRERGASEVTSLLVAKLRIERRNMATDNLGEFIAALRQRDWAYALRLGIWGVCRAPLQTVAAIRARLARRTSKMGYPKAD